MPRKTRLHRTTKTQRRPHASEIPVILTFDLNPEQKQDQPAKASADDAATEDAIRRMIEAAYT